MKKVLVLHPVPGAWQSILTQKGFEIVALTDKSKYTEAKIESLVKKYAPDALISFLIDPVKTTAMTASPKLKIVSNYAVGFDNVDVEAAKKLGIAVTNTPADGYAVAEFTASLVVSLLRKITEGHIYTSSGKYDGWDPNLFIGASLRGKTLGLMGSGRIGTAAAQILCKGFGMNVVYSDMVRNEFIEKELNAKKVETDELFKISDVVSLHVALNDSTRHLVNESRISSMKPQAYIINTSRGPVIDEEALTRALVNKKIAGAALDVFEFEPKISRTLRKLPNVLLTPHIASATTEVRNEMCRLVAQNIVDFFEGKKPQGAVYIPQ